MEFKYFNYLLPVLVLHVLALFGRLVSVSEHTGHFARRQSSVLTTQIQLSQRPSVETKKYVTESTSLKKVVSNQKIASESIEPSSTTFNSGEAQADVKNQYFADLKAHIEQHKHYPIMSRRLGQTGKVVVAFTLHGDGSFTNLHLHESCPFERLNVAALDAVKRVGKFRPIPKEINTGFLDIQVPIEYQTVN